MKLYVVKEGEIFSESPDIRLPDLSASGRDWIVVEAISPKDAIHQANLYDAKEHPRQHDMMAIFEKVKPLEDEEMALTTLLSELFPVPPVPGSIVIQLEAIGYTAIKARYSSKNRFWVAEIIGIDPKWKFTRKFIEGKRDLTHADRRAYRGVYFYYILEPNKVYEVSNPVSGKHTNRYFCRIEDDQEVIMTEQEVLHWLKEDLV